MLSSINKLIHDTFQQTSPVVNGVLLKEIDDDDEYVDTRSSDLEEEKKAADFTPYLMFKSS